jgi:N-carbamoylputrescine amidase
MASATTPRSSSPPDGRLVWRTRKLHIPVIAGYYEDRYFRPGPSDGDPFPLTVLPTSQRRCSAGLPDVLGSVVSGARARIRWQGAEVLVYPTAIGSEPDHLDFDTEPLWQQVIVANGVANGTFMVAINRRGRSTDHVLRVELRVRSVRRFLVQGRATSRRCW